MNAQGKMGRGGKEKGRESEQEKDRERERLLTVNSAFDESCIDCLSCGICCESRSEKMYPLTGGSSVCSSCSRVFSAE